MVARRSTSPRRARPTAVTRLPCGPQEERPCDIAALATQKHYVARRSDMLLNHGGVAAPAVGAFRTHTAGYRPHNLRPKRMPSIVRPLLEGRGRWTPRRHRSRCRRPRNRSGCQWGLRIVSRHRDSRRADGTQDIPQLNAIPAQRERRKCDSHVAVSHLTRSCHSDGSRDIRHGQFAAPKRMCTAKQVGQCPCVGSRPRFVSHR
jgi:hypothetical protein